VFTLWCKLDPDGKVTEGAIFIKIADYLQRKRESAVDNMCSSFGRESCGCVVGKT